MLLFQAGRQQGKNVMFAWGSVKELKACCKTLLIKGCICHKMFACSGAGSATAVKFKFRAPGSGNDSSGFEKLNREEGDLFNCRNTAWFNFKLLQILFIYGILFCLVPEYFQGQCAEFRS